MLPFRNSETRLWLNGTSSRDHNNNIRLYVMRNIHYLNYIVIFSWDGPLQTGSLPSTLCQLEYLDCNGRQVPQSIDHKMNSDLVLTGSSIRRPDSPVGSNGRGTSTNLPSGQEGPRSLCDSWACDLP